VNSFIAAVYLFGLGQPVIPLRIVCLDSSVRRNDSRAI
jgi:hypothetical protein